MSNTYYVNQYIDQYLENRYYKDAPSTFESLKSKANTLKKYFKKTLITDVLHSAIHSLLNKWGKRYSNKTLNEYLTILRGVFNLAMKDGTIALDPMDGISNYKVSLSEPLPFEKNELSKLYDTQMACQSGKNACDLNIQTGLRISELIAVAWEDIDWNKKELHVCRAKVLRDYKVPKTDGSNRIVELNDLAIEILKRQFALTGQKKPRKISLLKSDNKTRVQQTLSFVFYNCKTNKPFLHAAQFNKDFFTPFLKKAGVQHRGVGQLRHTFASQCLTAGINKDWIARQMGHSSTKMIDLHYGRWIKADAPDCANVLSQHLANVYHKDIQQPELNVSEAAVIPPELMAVMKTLQSQPELVSLIISLSGGAR